MNIHNNARLMPIGRERIVMQGIFRGSGHDRRRDFVALVAAFRPSVSYELAEIAGYLRFVLPAAQFAIFRVKSLFYTGVLVELV